jgi:hypothetical protein
MPDQSKTTRPDPASEDRKPTNASENTTSLNESVRARIAHPHKGDVGRAGTNEEIYQGSKTKELR